MIKLLISGRSIAELREEAQRFLDETSAKEITVSRNAQDEIADIMHKAIDLQPPVIDSTIYDEHDAQASSGLPANPLSPFGGPITSIPPTVAGSTADTFDKRGLPWDSRIHASSKALTVKGAWRYRRGVEQPEIDRVEQELLAQMKGHAVPAQPVVLPPTPAMEHQAGSSQAGNISVPSPFGPPPAVVPPLPATAPVMPPIPQPEPVTFSHSFETFKEQKNLIPLLGKLVESGKLTKEYIETLKNYFKVTEIWKLNDEQMREMFESFAGSGLITKVG